MKRYSTESKEMRKKEALERTEGIPSSTTKLFNFQVPVSVSSVRERVWLIWLDLHSWSQPLWLEDKVTKWKNGCWLPMLWDLVGVSGERCQGCVDCHKAQGVLAHSERLYGCTESHPFNFATTLINTCYMPGSILYIGVWQNTQAPSLILTQIDYSRATDIKGFQGDQDTLLGLLLVTIAKVTNLDS